MADKVYVEVPGQGFVEFPADMPQDEISAILDRDFGGGTFVPAQLDITAPEDPSFTNSFILGQLQADMGVLGLELQKASTQEEQVEVASKIHNLQQEMGKYSLPDHVIQGLSSDDWLDAFVEHPLDMAKHISAVALGTMYQTTAETAAATGVGAATGSVVPALGTLGGAAVGYATAQAGSFAAIEDGNKFIEILQESGVDIDNKNSLLEFFEDKGRVKDARDKSFAKGMTIGIFDAITFGLMGAPSKLLASTTALGKMKKAAQFSSETGLQMAGGAGGEAASQVVIGEPIHGGQVLAEAVGELALAPVDLGVGYLTGRMSGSEKSDTAPPPTEDRVAENVEENYLKAPREHTERTMQDLKSKVEGKTVRTKVRSKAGNITVDFEDQKSKDLFDLGEQVRKGTEVDKDLEQLVKDQYPDSKDVRKTALGFVNSVRDSLKDLPKGSKAKQGEQFAELTPGLYSNLANYLTSHRTEKASVEHWKGILKKASQHGIREEEIHQLGLLDEILTGDKPVTKKQLLDFIEDSQVRLTEQTYSIEDTKRDLEAIKKLRARLLGDLRSAYAGPDTFRRISERIRIGTTIDVDPKLGLDQSTVNEWNTLVGGSLPHRRFEGFTLPGGQNYKEVVLRYKPKSGNFTGGHFGTDDLLHIRMDERNNSLFVQEVQSDWHQAGRARGYEVIDETWSSTGWLPTPDAPFKKTWPLLGFKRALRYGIENGFDSVLLPRGRDTISNIQGWVKDPIPDIIQGTDQHAQRRGVVDFYDNVLPKQVNKYTRRWGQKLKPSMLKVKMGSDELVPGLETEYAVWKLDITPEMRRDVLMGQPMYARHFGDLLTAEQTKQEVEQIIISTINNIVGNRTNVELITLEDMMNEYGRNARGVTTLISNPLESTVTIAWNVGDLNSIQRTVVHEATHVARNLGLLSKREDEILLSSQAQKRLKEYIVNSEMFEVNDINRVLKDPEEVIAYANELYFGEDILGYEYPTKLPRYIDKIFSKVVKFFRMLGNWLHARGFQTEEDILRNIRLGRMAKRTSGTGPFRDSMAVELNLVGNTLSELTKNKDFKKFFRNSAVLDRNGFPKTVFHATNKEFDVFKFTNDIGFHFGTPSAANVRVNWFTEDEVGQPLDITGWHIKPAFIRLERPLKLPDIGHWFPEIVLNYLTKGYNTEPHSDKIFSEEESARIRKLLKRAKSKRKAHEILRREIQKAGYDGVIYENDVEGGTSYIVFSNSQVLPAYNINFAEDIYKKYEDSMDKFVDGKQPSLVNKYINSMRHVGFKFPKFGKVQVLRADQDADRITHLDEMTVNTKTGERLLASIDSLQNSEKENLVKALELVRRMDLHQVPKNEDGQYEITNTDFVHGTLTNPGETIVLSDKEGAVLEAVRKGMDYDRQKQLEAYLNHNGLDSSTTSQDLKDMLKDYVQTARSLNAALEAGDLDVTAEDVRQADEIVLETKKIIQEVEAMEKLKGADYLPEMRFGDWGVAVRQRGPDGEPEDLLHFETIETTGLNKLGAKKRLQSLREKLLEEYPDAFVSVPFKLTHKYLTSSEQTKALLTLDQLSGLLNLDNRETYSEIRDAILDEIRLNGFSAHKKRSKHTPGYSHDIARVMGQYALASSNYTAKLKYYNVLRQAVSEISPETEPDLRRMAENYLEYTSSPIEEFALLRALGFMYYLGFNISSALLQIGTIPTITYPYLSMVSSPIKAAEALTYGFSKSSQAFLKTLTEGGKAPDRFVMFDPAVLKDLGIPESEVAQVISLWDSGITKPQRTQEQSGLGIAESPLLPEGYARKFRGALDLSAFIFNTVETVSRNAAVLAVLKLARDDPNFMHKWNYINRENGLWANELAQGTASPIKAAKHAVEDTFGQYGKINRAKFMRGIGALIFQFNSYVIQMVELMTRMASKYGNTGKMAAGLMAAMLIMFGGLQGLPAAEDLKDLVEFLWKKQTGTRLNIDETFREFIEETTDSKELAEVASRGVFRLAGLDIARRATLGNLPMFDILKATIGVQGDTADVLGVPGSMIIGNMVDFHERLKYMDTLDATMQTLPPQFLKNLWAGAEWYYKGARTSRGDMLVHPHDSKLEPRMTIPNAINKAVGFNSTKVARARELYRYEGDISGAVSEKQSNYYKRLALARVDLRRANQRGDEDEAERARRKISEIKKEINVWNKDRPPHERLILDMDHLRNLTNKIYYGRDYRKAKAPKKARRKLHEIYN